MTRVRNRNEPLIALVCFVESLIDQYQMSMATIDPEYGYQNEMNEDEAAQLKDEFRELLNATLDSAEI